jgi:hypothetical protein
MNTYLYYSANSDEDKKMCFSIIPTAESTRYKVINNNGKISVEPGVRITEDKLASELVLVEVNKYPVSDPKNYSKQLLLLLLESFITNENSASTVLHAANIDISDEAEATTLVYQNSNRFVDHDDHDKFVETCAHQIAYLASLFGGSLSSVYKILFYAANMVLRFIDPSSDVKKIDDPTIINDVNIPIKIFEIINEFVIPVSKNNTDQNRLFNETIKKHSTSNEIILNIIDSMNYSQNDTVTFLKLLLRMRLFQTDFDKINKAVLSIEELSDDKKKQVTNIIFGAKDLIESKIETKPEISDDILIQKIRSIVDSFEISDDLLKLLKERVVKKQMEGGFSMKSLTRGLFGYKKKHRTSRKLTRSKRSFRKHRSTRKR